MPHEKKTTTNLSNFACIRTNNRGNKIQHTSRFQKELDPKGSKLFRLDPRTVKKVYFLRQRISNRSTTAESSSMRTATETAS